jgi:hypothetical protein
MGHGVVFLRARAKPWPSLLVEKLRGLRGGSLLGALAIPSLPIDGADRHCP